MGKIWYVQNLQRPGIEPGPPAWQASILPLNQRCPLHKQPRRSAKYRFNQHQQYCLKCSLGTGNIVIMVQSV